MLVSFIFMKLCLCNGYIKLQRLMIYPNYTDTKLFLNILILLMTQQEWQCIPNHYSMWKQRRNKRSLCESGAVEGWEDVCIWWSDSCKAGTLGVHSGSQWNHGQSRIDDTFLKVFYQKVGVCSWCAACHYRHHSIFWYRPCMQNTEQIPVFVYLYREVRIPISTGIFKIGADECNI